MRKSAAWPLARPAIPHRPSCPASFGDTRPVVRKRSCSPLCPSYISFSDRVALPADALGTLGIKIDINASRNNPIHHEPMTEQLARQAQPVFLEAVKLGQAEAQRGIIAQHAQIAKVIRHPLPLQQQGTQPARAQRDLAACK
jgi:hypothetical protein